MTPDDAQTAQVIANTMRQQAETASLLVINLSYTPDDAIKAVAAGNLAGLVTA